MQTLVVSGTAEPPEPTSSAEADAAVPDQPPIAPPTSLYANLPTEWPLARISVWMRHISVLLRVTLYRRLAELSFRGVDFTKLPTEVVKYTRKDFDNVCGAMAAQLAALFAFLHPNQTKKAREGKRGTSTICGPVILALWPVVFLCQKLRSENSRSRRSTNLQS